MAYTNAGKMLTRNTVEELQDFLQHSNVQEVAYGNV